MKFYWLTEEGGGEVGDEPSRLTRWEYTGIVVEEDESYTRDNGEDNDWHQVTISMNPQNWVPRYSSVDLADNDEKPQHTRPVITIDRH